MYIEYHTPQRVADPNYTEYDSKGGDYRPTWLIRTADWVKVPGYEATDGYHTVSYVWEQSGEKVLKFDGEYDLKDDGHHRVVEVGKEWVPNSNFLFRHRQQVLASHEVTYDELLQQICKDFDIEYLWYDKTCIDQTNKEEKHREIKQMHLIYSNARYTLALVPEVNICGPRDFERMNWVTKWTEAKTTALGQMEKSLWWKRSWTLEEVMMSTRILIVGRNTHFWSLASIKQGKRKESDVLAEFMLGFTEREMKSANQVLRFAHIRTSTKQHDKIYALANIFHGIVDIEVDYGIDVSIAMNGFYRQLAEKDLSVMCFGSNLQPHNGKPVLATTMDSYDLPSWTGVSGKHLERPIADITLDKNGDYTVDDNMRLHIQCRSYTIRPTKYTDYEFLSDEERRKKAQENYYEVITSMDDFDGDESEALDWSQECMVRATACIPTHYHKPVNNVPFLSPILPLSLTVKCDECVILGVVFDSLSGVTVSDDDVPVGYIHYYLSPVARKSADDSSYKIIGVILLKCFTYYETRPTPQDYMDQMFNSLGCESQHFCIE